MIKNTIAFCVLALLVSNVFTQAVAPAPYCNSRPVYTTLPMTIGQILTYDFSNSFTGYNLDIRVKSNVSYASIPPKIALTDSRDYNLSGIRNLQISKKGNNWDKQFQLVTDNLGMTLLYVGTLKNSSSVPIIDTVISVEYETNTQCFDAALFLDYGIAIVDCAEKSNSSQTISWQNKFIYVDLVKKSVIRKVYNEIYADFTDIRRRSFQKYQDFVTGYSYILRTYYADGVDRQNAGNTYIQFFSAQDPNDLQILNIVDRTFLGLKELAIADFKIYLGDIFFLDYFRGLYRLDILKSQHILITGRYQAQFFNKFAVYSDDLDEQVLITLANNHAIYQINWDNPNFPLLLTKYTIPDNSRVHHIAVDQTYLIVQSSANTTIDKDKYLVLNYTWFFTKGSRTYMNAYKVIQHDSNNVFFDLNSQQERIMIIDPNGIKNYQINEAIITIKQTDSSVLNTTSDLIVEAVSTDPNDPSVVSCTQKTTLYFVTPDTFKIWKTGITVPTTYYSNYPGTLEIYLGDLVVGPNITYTFQETMIDYDIPVNWVNQQNQSFVNIDKPPIFGNIEFFHTQVVPHFGEDTVIYFFQDIQNITTVANCVHPWDDINLYCRVVNSIALNSKILHFTTSIYTINQDFNVYYYMFNLEANPNVIYIYDFFRHRRVAAIQFPSGFQGTVGHIACSNGYLYLTLPYIKTINAYKLSKCQNFNCPLEFSLNAKSLKPLGVDYFAPVELITTRHHPEVLFIKSLGSIIILDVDNNENLILLQQLFSQAIVDTAYKIAVNNDYLVVISSPNLIQQYSLRQIYSKRQVTLFKSLPLYNYVIPDDFDMEFSDFGDLFYINTIDQTTNKTTILIYRTGSFSVSSLYDVINLPGRFQHINLEIQVSGFFVDYVSIIASGAFYLYRQYEYPVMVVQDTFSDFQFYIHYANSQTSQNLTLIDVKIANYPKDFKPTQEFEKIRSKLKFEASGHFTYDTRKWFDGHILGYNYSCPECDEKVRLRSHIHQSKDLPIGGSDYAETGLGGIVLFEDLFKLQINGSIDEVILLPDQKLGQVCRKVASRSDNLLTATACQNFGGGVNIYITSQASEKGFTWGPHRTGAFNAKNVQLVNNILVVVDVDQRLQYRSRPGGVFLYSLNLDPISEYDLDEIQYINSDDFQGAHGWDQDEAYIGNAHLMYDGFDDTYRLYVTQTENGLFVIDFKYQSGNRQLHILTTNYIDLNKLLEQSDFHVPDRALFTAITHTGVLYNPHFEMQNIVVNINGFHTFQITLIYDDDGHILSSILHRVYYRYAFYDTINYIRAGDEYLAVGFLIPQIFTIVSDYSRQLIALYDARNYQHQSQKGYSQRYMLGSHMMKDRTEAAFGFNRTFNQKQNGTRIGLVIVDRSANNVYQTSISRNLSVEVEKNFKTQKITLKPFSDFQTYTFDLDIISNYIPTDGLGTWGIVLIVTSAVVGTGFLGYVSYLIWQKKKLEQENEFSQPLLQQPPTGPSQTTPLNLNESVAYSQSVRNTLLDNRQSLPGNLKGTQTEAQKQNQKIQEKELEESKEEGEQDGQQEEQNEENEQDENNQNEGQNNNEEEEKQEENPNAGQNNS